MYHGSLCTSQLCWMTISHIFLPIHTGHSLCQAWTSGECTIEVLSNKPSITPGFRPFFLACAVASSASPAWHHHTAYLHPWNGSWQINSFSTNKAAHIDIVYKSLLWVLRTQFIQQKKRPILPSLRPSPSSGNWRIRHLQLVELIAPLFFSFKLAFSALVFWH